MKISVFKHWLKSNWAQDGFNWLFSATFKSKTLHNGNEQESWACLLIKHLVQTIKTSSTMKKRAPRWPQVPSDRLARKLPPPHSPAPVRHPLPTHPGRGRRNAWEGALVRMDCHTGKPKASPSRYMLQSVSCLWLNNLDWTQQFMCENAPIHTM